MNCTAASLPKQPAPAMRALPRIPTGMLGGLFVLIWSSGYVAGKVALDHAGAFSLLEVRFAAGALAFALLAAAARADWPGWLPVLHSAVVGLLSLALQFGAIYVGVQRGAEVGVAALAVGAMPLVTAALAPWFGERVGARQWLGLVLGLSGVILVLVDRLTFGAANPGAYALLLLGLLAISIGTLYQKRHASHIDLRVGLGIQHAAAALAIFPFAWAEGFRLDTSPALAWSLVWIIANNSLAASALLFALLRRGAANAVAHLFFLIPPITAVFGFVLFGERFTLLKLAGFAIAAAGVYLGTRQVRADKARSYEGANPAKGAT